MLLMYEYHLTGHHYMISAFNPVTCASLTDQGENNPLFLLKITPGFLLAPKQDFNLAPFLNKTLFSQGRNYEISHVS